MLPHKVSDWVRTGSQDPKFLWGAQDDAKKQEGLCPHSGGECLFCLTFLYTGHPRETALEKISLPRSIGKLPTWFRVSLSVGYGVTMRGKQSIIFVPEIVSTRCLFRSLSILPILSSRKSSFSLVFSTS